MLSTECVPVSILKLDSYSNVSIFQCWAMTLNFSIQTPRHRAAIDTHAERFQKTDRILCHKHEILFKLNFFQLNFSIQTPCHRAAINTHAERFQKTDRILCHKHEILFKLNFFQLMEWHCSWDSVSISIYRLDTHYLKNGNAHATKQWKMLCVRVWV